MREARRHRLTPEQDREVQRLYAIEKAAAALVADIEKHGDRDVSLAAAYRKLRDLVAPPRPPEAG